MLLEPKVILHFTVQSFHGAISRLVRNGRRCLYEFVSVDDREIIGGLWNFAIQPENGIRTIATFDIIFHNRVQAAIDRSISGAAK
jgi:hypothetical protein